MDEKVQGILCTLYREWGDAEKDAQRELLVIEEAIHAEGYTFIQNPVLGTYKLERDLNKTIEPKLLQIT